MTADLLDGNRVASEIRAEVADKVRQFVHAGGPQPCLTAVLVGEDPASQVYVRNKSRACEKAGIDGRTVRLDAGVSQQELLRTVQKLNDDPAVPRNPCSVAPASRWQWRKGFRRACHSRHRGSPQGRRCVLAHQRWTADAGPPQIFALHTAWDRATTASLQPECRW